MVKKSTSRSSKKAESEEVGATHDPREDLLVENFVGLQHAMTNLSVKFGNLSDNISKLLEIFEEAAKQISKSGGDGNEELTKKIDYLLDQNKTIARGLVMMEEKVRGHATPPGIAPAPVAQPPPARGPLPPGQQQGSRPRPLPRL